MLVLARALRTKSRVRKAFINLLLKALCHLIVGARIKHAMIVITDGQYGCVELTDSLTSTHPGWTTMFSDEPQPDSNKPVLH